VAKDWADLMGRKYIPHLTEGIRQLLANGISNTGCAAFLFSARNSPPMNSKTPDGRRDATKARGRDATPLRLSDAPRAIARTAVYAGLIAVSILLWWAIGKLALG